MREDQGEGVASQPSSFFLSLALFFFPLGPNYREPAAGCLLNDHPCKVASNQSPNHGFSIVFTSIKRLAFFKRALYPFLLGVEL